MTEYEEWQNTPGRFGVLVSKGGFKKGRYAGEEIELFRAEFKERPRQITTKVIIGKPDTEERIICNALWDTGCTDTCISQTVADELKLKEYGKKTMTDMTAGHLCTFYIADIKSRNSQFYFSEERCELRGDYRNGYNRQRQLLPAAGAREMGLRIFRAYSRREQRTAVQDFLRPLKTPRETRYNQV